MARRKSAPKLLKQGSGGFADTGRLANKTVVGRAAAKRSAKTAANRKGDFNRKHPRNNNGKFKNK